MDAEAVPSAMGRDRLIPLPEPDSGDKILYPASRPAVGLLRKLHPYKETVGREKGGHKNLPVPGLVDPDRDLFPARVHDHISGRSPAPGRRQIVSVRLSFRESIEKMENDDGLFFSGYAIGGDFSRRGRKFRPGSPVLNCPRGKRHGEPSVRGTEHLLIPEFGKSLADRSGRGRRPFLGSRGLGRDRKGRGRLHGVEYRVKDRFQLPEPVRMGCQKSKIVNRRRRQCRFVRRNGTDRNDAQAEHDLDVFLPGAEIMDDRIASGDFSPECVHCGIVAVARKIIPHL